MYRYYRYLIVSFLSVLVSGICWAQSTYTLSGYVKDAASGETLIGATVIIKGTNNGTTSNLYGFYSLSVPQGSYELLVSYVGYETVVKPISLTENLTLSFELVQSGKELEEVVVTGEAENENITSLEMSTAKLEIATIQKIPALLGEVDLVRSIQFLPGVSTVGEGATGFNVRGGGIDQNLVLLDEAPVYNSSHLFGFFSVFNPDAVKDVQLKKGGIPAQYGGRLSSILDVRMKEGNNKRFTANGGVGLIFSRLTLEGPIKQDKASFLIAGRRSYIDVLAKPFLDESFSDSKFFFYDLTLKANYNLNARNRIFLSGYFGRDRFAFDEARFSWGSATATFRWNHLFNDKLFSNLTLFYSDYDYEIGFGEDKDTFDWNSRILNYSLKENITWFVRPGSEVNFGTQVILYDFEPATALAQTDGEFRNISLDNKYALESAAYVSHSLKLSSRLAIEYGLRFSVFNYMGPGAKFELSEPQLPDFRKDIVSETEVGRWENIATYSNLEPRFSLTYTLNNQSSLKASYNRMAQYLHLVSNTTAATPLDVWTPSTNNIKPQIANQVALGYFRNFRKNTIETSVEVYYKDLQNQVDYVNGADLLINRYLEAELLNGSGRAYGVELSLKKTDGRFNGWVSYTLSRTERRVPQINNGDWYPNRFDQTHNLKTVAFYDLNKRWELSATLTMVSGTPATFPTHRFEWQGYVVPHNANNSRNNYRLPLYHRLDISATLQGKEKPGKRTSHYWVFAVYNLYGRQNPFSTFFQQQEVRPLAGEPVGTQAVQFSVIGSPIPSVSYNFKF